MSDMSFRTLKKKIAAAKNKYAKANFYFAEAWVCHHAESLSKCRVILSNAKDLITSTICIQILHFVQDDTIIEEDSILIHPLTLLQLFQILAEAFCLKTIWWSFAKYMKGSVLIQDKQNFHPCVILRCVHKGSRKGLPLQVWWPDVVNADGWSVDCTKGIRLRIFTDRTTS